MRTLYSPCRWCFLWRWPEGSWSFCASDFVCTTNVMLQLPGNLVNTADMPASAQMTESPINTNTMNGGMRVEGRVTRPPKSTPTKCRHVVVTRYDEEQWGTTMFWRETTKNDERRRGTTSTRTLTIVLRLYNETTTRRLQARWSLDELWDEGETNFYSVR